MTVVTAIASTSIGILVKRYRLAHGWTQDELGQRAGIGMRTISDIERGLSRYPHRDTVQQLIAIFALQGEAALDFQRAARITREVAPTPQGFHHFPQPTTPFTGREPDIAAAQRTLTHTQARLLTLVGPAGVGKTRLACEIARTLGNKAPDAPWHFVDLTQSVTTDEVVGELIRQLGIGEQHQHVPLTLLDGWLQQRRVHLVLDNFEQAISAAPLIERLLMAHPQLHLCITSRIPLKISAEIVQEVAPFPIPDHRRLSPQALGDEPTVRLFAAVAQSVMPSFALTAANSALIVRICARLDGLPLGIELAAAQVAQYPLTELLRQIARFPGRIMAGFLGPLVEGRPRRQQSLGNAIAWSYDRLDAPSQILFRRLCIFAGEFDAAAAEGVCDPYHTLAIDVLDGLAMLIDQHLVQAVALPDANVPPRFALLTVIREYGLTLLTKRGELLALRQRHASYYADLIRQHEADFVGELQGLRLTLFTRDYENIVAALRQAREQRDALLGLQLVGSLWWYWEKRRTLTEGRDWVEQMLSLVDPYAPQVDDATLGRALYGAAVLANVQGDLSQAQHYGQRCLEICVRMHDLGRIGQAHALLGAVAKATGDDAKALNEYEQALTVLRQVDSPRQLVSILNNLSALAIDGGDLARAKALLEESLAIKRQLGDQRGIAVGLINLSEWYKQQGEYAQALIHIAEAERAFADLGDQVGMAMAANNAGEIALARDDPAGAILALHRSLSHFQQGEHQVGIALVQRNLGDAYRAAGDSLAATRAWQASLAAQPQGPHAEHCRAALGYAA